jgi:hypothetical protein
VSTRNYRVLRRTQPDGSPWFEIHEVNYDDQGAPRSCGMLGARVGGEDLAELGRVIDMLRWALDEPIIENPATRRGRSRRESRSPQDADRRRHGRKTTKAMMSFIGLLTGNIGSLLRARPIKPGRGQGSLSGATPGTKEVRGRCRV